MTTSVKEFNIIICGVGGQGIILMSELLGHAAVQDNLGVHGSEVLGMAQRGGSVFSNIRIGEKIYAPMTPQGKCDIMVAVEPSEALRYIKELSDSSLVVINTRDIKPFTVALGQSGYPEMDVIIEKVKMITSNIITLDAVTLAQEAGNILTTNTVMLGALFGSGGVPVKLETIKEVIGKRVPPKAIEANLKAFDLGYEVVVNYLKSK
ncbi:indolepyruvate ferredoxin oxidoreductase subunit beta [Chloroflexota bacterium]